MSYELQGFTLLAGCNYHLSNPECKGYIEVTFVPQLPLAFERFQGLPGFVATVQLGSTRPAVLSLQDAKELGWRVAPSIKEV